MRAWSLWHYAKATHPLLPLASPHPAPPLPPPQLCLAGPLVPLPTCVLLNH